jgi:hypothetical protein
MRRLERWHHAIQNNNGSLMTFDEYVDQRLLPQNTQISQSCYGMYGFIVPRWLDLFPRDHLLILSFDESQSHPERYLKRIHDFLNLPVNHSRPLAFGERTFSAQVAASGNATSATEQDETNNTTCSALDKLWEAFASSNQKLYELLERHPGPSMEERPFPRFSHPCQKNKS